MAAKNDVTGDLIKSRILSKQGRENWDLIFNKNKKMKNYLLATATWCGPCQSLKTQLSKMNLQDKVEVMDIDSNPEFVKKYKIRTVPTLVVVENDNFKTVNGQQDIITELNS